MAASQSTFAVPVTSMLAAAVLVSGQAAGAAAAAPPAPPAQPHAGVVPEPSTATAATRLVLPLKAGSYRYSSQYGPRCIPVIGGSTFHRGQDLAAANNDPIYAIADGTVTRTNNGTNSTSGYIVIRHAIGGKTYHSVYVHMWNATTHVKAGSVVKAGQQIGLVGSSGPSTAPHLHLEVWEGAWYTGTSLDTTTWLKARGVDLLGNAGRVYSSVVPPTCSYYAARQVSLLSQPNAAALPLAALPVNTPMTGVPADMSNGYVRVTAKGLTGWVAHSAVSPSRVAGAVSPGPSAGGTTPVSSGTTTTTPLSGRYKVLSGVNMRAGAGNTYNVVKVLPRGAVVAASAATNGWYKVAYSGTSGWVYSSYLTSATAADTTGGTPAPPAAPAPPATAAATHTTTAGLNLRKGAGTTYGIQKVLAKGTAVTALGTQGSWTRVAAGSAEGWVSTAYLKKTTAAAPAPAPEKPSAAPTAVFRTAANLNLRSGAGTGYRVLKVLSKGTSVTVVSVKGTWSQVKAGSTTGWVSTSYLAPPAAAAVPTGTTGLAPSGYRTTTTVNVRKGPSDAQAVVKILAKGASVTVDARNGAWRRVTVGATTGWAPASQLTDGTVAESASTSTTAAVNFRKGPSTTYASHGMLRAGTKVTVNGTSGLWKKVTYAGKTGYIHGAYLK
ncbi:hypothetical protein NCCP1664_28950 [Zafaria cholistanensis]|uniref:SH3b domain-containing protein n=1 Tax=Zafaria cholistanensis TaxID=1682741 RepID=A0A5A7NUA0_9MICC|nr:SH3 domain-containing protein [Zafaria cholistanensis]GER24400.1 hypothetical protein NCCP1664_28950 [Zafaria cholistanensis]